MHDYICQHVKYHGPEWRDLVSRGWVTESVDSKGIATMLLCSTHNGRSKWLEPQFTAIGSTTYRFEGGSYLIYGDGQLPWESSYLWWSGNS